MSQISVISKLTGVETTTEGTQVTLSHSSIVELHVERASPTSREMVTICWLRCTPAR